jgi:hypothetical protein
MAIPSHPVPAKQSWSSPRPSNPSLLESSDRSVGKTASLRNWFRVGRLGGEKWSATIDLWRRFLAVSRFSLIAVCEESASLGYSDYHTSADDIDEAPWFAEGGARCKRCGKRFRL